MIEKTNRRHIQSNEVEYLFETIFVPITLFGLLQLMFGTVDRITKLIS